MRQFDGYIKLLDAIVHMAARDHRRAVRKLRNNPEDKYALSTKDETERFFRSDWFRFIADYEGEVPGAAPQDCGNYLLHDLPMARLEAAKYLREVLEQMTPAHMEYPAKEVD